MKPIKLFTIAFLLLLTSTFIQAQTNFRPADTEFFIEIPRGGKYTVSLGDETISSTSGRFRFFDVRYNRVTLVIETDRQTIYRSDVFIKPGMRSIAIFNRNKVEVIKELPLQNTYLNNWDKCLDGNTSGPGNLTSNFIPSMSQEAFSRFIRSVKSAPFDKDKLSIIDVGASNAAFNVDQVMNIVNQFSFTDGKIAAAKKLYPSVTDPENGFQLMDAVTFSSDKEKMKKIILRGNYTYQQNGQRVF